MNNEYLFKYQKYSKNFWKDKLIFEHNLNYLSTIAFNSINSIIINDNFWIFYKITYNLCIFTKIKTWNQ